MPLFTHDLDFLRKLVKERSGIVLGADKAYLIESRLAPVAKLSNLPSVEALCQKLKTSEGLASTQLIRLVIEAMTTNETLFFRDGHPFEALTGTILPELMRARAERKELNIWCAASSTGQEPYSIAMAIKHTLPSLTSWKLKIIATDIDRQVIARAKTGVYSQLEVSRGLPPEHLPRYFVKQGADYQLKDDVRRMVEFKELNLLESFGNIGTCDVVFVRNVLIYFDVETKKAILGKVARLMAPDGILFLGGSETTMNIDDRFERIETLKGGCFRFHAAG